MSIITPRDTITITIDNLKRPPQVQFSCSRQLPLLQVIGILMELATQLLGQFATAASGMLPAGNPTEKPSTNPSRGDNGTS